MARPIFVVGSMGSGTTLTRLMLDSHPNIMIAPETGFMRSVSAIQSIPFWHRADRWIKQIGITPDELDRATEEFYDHVFGMAAARRGASRWGDKTPFHTEFLGAAARVFPEAVFVGTIRHPGAVAGSMGRFGWSFRKGVVHWCNANESVLDARALVGERLRVWRYEDLVSSPEDVMREVLDFVDEPWNPLVLEHHRHKSGEAEGGTKAGDPIDSSRVEKWRDAATEKNLAFLDSWAGPLASFFGYDTGHSRPDRPMSGGSDGQLGVGADSWADLDDEIAAIPRRAERRSFENSMYTQMDLAAELGRAYEKGARGGRIRRPYSRMLPVTQGGSLPVEGAPDPRNADLTRRVRRRVARIIDPDS